MNNRPNQLDYMRTALLIIFNRQAMFICINQLLTIKITPLCLFLVGMFIM